ncbi:hypothetical protein C8R45DRAFT_1106921 [Mycena sanguinolenta]|nr:hypothetical protein C8R45DRAFT_1106921 [Mycena sanguinolenta]
MTASANPAHYNTADRVRFENYVDALRNFGAGCGTFPGPTPPGYREHFRVLHRYAPLPEEYLWRMDQQTEAKAQLPPATAEVSMSSAALGTILSSQQKLMKDVIAMSNTHNRLTFHRGGKFNRGNNFGGRGGYGKHLIALVNKNDYNDDIASDIATAGGLTEDELEFENIQTIEEGEIEEDNGFNASLI